MQFDSVAFVLFLPLVYLLYWAGRRRGQNLLVLLASYVFYGWWDWRFLGLILVSTLTDYVVGARLGVATTRPRRRAWLALSLIVNLGILLAFKYLGFFVESAERLLEGVGFAPDLPTLRFVLPVGVSFYTFQTLSYTIDVYRRRVAPCRDPLAFAGFVAFFPQLVAGPIERAAHLLPQFARPRRFDPDQAKDGARQILYGLLLKLVLADNLAPLVDEAYRDPAAANPWMLLWATYAFAFQIYGDFAGYSHIAIGTARLFGFDLQQNFACPYFACSPAEFWRRWHISLSSWFRDYVYIPLGGSRGGPLRRRANLLLTFVLSGLWHGAAATFLVWGLLHGLLVSMQWWRTPTDLTRPGQGARSPWLGMLLTFHAVTLGWVFFRAADLGDAWLVCAQLGALRDSAFVPPDSLLLGLVGLVLALEWVQRARPHGLAIGALPLPARWGVYLTACLAIAVLGSTHAVPFIYFQF